MYEKYNYNSYFDSIYRKIVAKLLKLPKYRASWLLPNVKVSFRKIKINAPSSKITEMLRRFTYVREPTASIFQDRGVDPGPMDRTTDAFPGFVTESPLTPGRYEVLDKQLARAHKDAFYTLESRRYYVHHSRVYSRDVCTSSYASNDEKKTEREREKEGERGSQKKRQQESERRS